MWNYNQATFGFGISKHVNNAEANGSLINMFTCLMQLSYNQIIRLTDLVKHYSQTKVFKLHFIACFRQIIALVPTEIWKK